MKHPFLQKLLAGQTVEWKALGEVCDLTTDFTAAGSFASNAENVKYLKNKGFAQLVRTTDLKSNFKNKSNFVYVDEHAFNYLWRVNLDKESIILPNVGNCGEVYYTKPNNFPYEFNVLAPNALLLRSSSEDNKFLFYLFHCRFFQIELSKITSSTGQTKFNKTNLKKIQIPIPPLSLQKEIVKILDKMTELEATLEAELALRAKQYRYYRDLLLDCENPKNPFSGSLKVEWKTLGEVAKKISSGGTPKTGIAEYYDGDIPWLRTQEVNFGEIWDTGIKITKDGLKKSSAKWIPENCVVVAMYGATVGRVGINKIPLTTNQACANIEVDEDILHYKYLFHYLWSKYEYIKSLGTGSQTNINAQILKKIKIPIPPLETQAQIVAILDKFETLTHSISEGLPHEIALRRKQYEYYREKLLNFPRLSSGN